MNDVIYRRYAAGLGSNQETPTNLVSGLGDAHPPDGDCAVGPHSPDPITHPLCFRIDVTQFLLESKRKVRGQFRLDYRLTGDPP